MAGLFVVVTALGPAWGSALSGMVLVAAWRGAAARRRRRRRRVETHLATIAELLAAAMRAGLSTRLALGAVGSRHPRAGLVGLADVCALLDRNLGLVESLQRWAGAGGATRRLATVLIDGEQTGAPLADDLVSFASDRRRELRRDAEERARRLPVLLLLPLVFCVLPAFVVVAVVPMVVTGASSISFPS